MTTTAAVSRPPRELWIFGYGSLMWRPGFPYLRSAHARLDGYHRCFCVYTIHHRGTPVRPGMVLGLDRGGTCEGIAYLVAGEHAAATRAYLAEREYADGVYPYVEGRRMVTLLEAGHPRVMALTYFVERNHPGYAGRPDLARQAQMLRGARGLSGGNIDYLMSTLAHLAALGIRERALERLVGLVGAHLKPGRVGTSPLSTAGVRNAVRRQPIALPKLLPTLRTRYTHRRQLAADH